MSNLDVGFIQCSTNDVLRDRCIEISLVQFFCSKYIFHSNIMLMFEELSIRH